MILYGKKKGKTGMLFPMRPTTPITLPKTPNDYWIQSKFNGWNIVIDEGEIFTRRGTSITNWNCWQDIDLYPDHPINGELIALNERREDVSKIKTGKVDYKIMAFDIMIEDLPIEERLVLLQSMDLGSKAQVCTTVNGKDFREWFVINSVFRLLVGQNGEGLVLKKKNSLYYIGEYESIDSPDWIKLKQLITL